MIVRTTDRRAVGLLEIVICIVLLTLGILPILQAHRASSESLRFSRDEVTAGTLACQLVERFKLEPYAFLAEANLGELVAEDPILSPWSAGGTGASTGTVDAYRRICERFERRVSFRALSGVGRGVLEASVHWTDTREGRSTPRRFRCAMVVTRQRFPWGAP